MKRGYKKEKNLKEYALQFFFIFILAIILILFLKPEKPILPSPAKENLVAYYNFDDNVNDQSGNNNNGTLNGATYVTGKTNKALNFNGVDDYVEVPDSNSLDLTDELTITMWVKPTDSNSALLLIKEGTSSFGKYSVYRNGAGTYSFRINEDAAAVYLGTLSNNEWHHIAFTYDKNNLIAYLNGSEVASSPYTNSIEVSSGNLFLGNYSQWSFNGTIDELKIWNRALNSSEIAEDAGLTISCTANWTQVIHNCTSIDAYIISYTDTSSCGQTKANETVDCDYDGNGIIGEPDDMNLDDININKVEIDGDEFDEDENYTDMNEEKVEFIDDDNITRVEFNWEFDNKPLNFKIIEIKMQDSNDDFGWLLIEGINETKTVRIDRKDNGNAVCVKNTHVENIDDISDDCDESREYLVPCPGDEGSYDCVITNNKLIVSGITRSAIREYNTGGSTNCTTNWQCGSWSTCTNNVRTRTCTDSNSCGTIIGRPAESEACTPTPTCIESWTCTAYTPTKCPKDETQTRTCTDSNSCGTTTSKPSETKGCTYEESFAWLFYVVIAVLGIAILTIIILIIIFARKSEKSQKPRNKIQFQGQPQPQQYFR